MACRILFSNDYELMMPSTKNPHQAVTFSVSFGCSLDVMRMGIDSNSIILFVYVTIYKEMGLVADVAVFPKKINVLCFSL